MPQDLIAQGISYKLINHTKGIEIKGQLDEERQSLRVFGDKAEKVEWELDAIIIKEIDINDLGIDDNFIDEDEDCHC